MSFGQVETSTNEGSPINLYLFRFGEGEQDVYRYTDDERDFDFDDGVGPPGLKTYKAIAIDRDEITASGKLEDASLAVRTDKDAELSDLFKFYPPSSEVTLIIRQGHADDPDKQFLVAWSGRVLGWQIEGEQAEFTCEALSTSLKRTMLRRHYQYGCPHVLYGPMCRADREAATTNAIVIGVNGAVLSFDASWQPDELQPKHEGGIAAWTLNDGRTVQRTILRSFIDGQVILAGPALGLEVGDTVSLSLGCNHTMGDCSELFANILNFGGQPWIPLKNPVGLVNNFY